MSATPEVRLRDWQIEAIQSYRDPQDFLALVTPGGGKTIFALQIAKLQRQGGKVEQIIVVCPTSYLKTQWAQAASEHFGLKLASIEDYESGFDGILTTYQQVTADPEMFNSVCSAGPVLVVLDEIHHASDQNTWGDSLRQAFQAAKHRLCLTGTAFRSDSSQIPFVSYREGQVDPDYIYGYVRANQDGLVRSLKFPLFDGSIRWQVEGEDATEFSFAQEANRTDRSRRLNAALNPNSNFVRALLSSADAKLRENPGYAGLVVAKNKTHANELAHVLAELTSEKPPVVTHDNPQSSKIIEDFRSTGRWLVAVKMVSEGVDIPRLLVLAYLSNVCEDLFFTQAVGRVVRSGLGAGDKAWCFIPNHPEFVRMAGEITEDKLHRIYDLPSGSGVSWARTGEHERENVYFLGADGWLLETLSTRANSVVSGLVSEKLIENRKTQLEAKFARNRARYENCVASGLCSRCLKPAVAGKTSCSKCRSLASDSARTRKLLLKEAGLCTSCGINAAVGKATCADCLEKQSQTFAKRYIKKDRKRRNCQRLGCANFATAYTDLCEQCRDYRCSDCGAPAATGKKRCSGCSKKNNRLRESARRKARKAAGLCLRCEKPAVVGKTCCPDCLARYVSESAANRSKKRMTGARC